MRQFMEQNEGREIGRHVWREKAQAEAYVARRVVAAVLQWWLENPLGGGQGNLGVLRVNIESVDGAEHVEKVGLVDHEQHLRIGLEQVHTGGALTGRIKRVDFEMP